MALRLQTNIEYTALLGVGLVKQACIGFVTPDGLDWLVMNDQQFAKNALSLQNSTSGNPVILSVGGDFADTNGSLTIQPAGSGTLTLGSDTGTTVLKGASFALDAPVTITTTSSHALAVGPNGTTNPVFQVDDSQTNAAAGLIVSGKAAGSGIFLSAQSSGTDEAIHLNSKGAANLVFQDVGTGNTQIAQGGLTITAGNLAMGTTPAVGQIIRITGTSQLSAAGPNAAYFLSDATYPVTVTGTAAGVQVTQQTAAGSYTLTNLIGFRVGASVKGAGSTITNAIGYQVDAFSSGSTNTGVLVNGPNGTGTNYGIDITAPSGGTTNLGLRVNGGVQVTSGNLGVGSAPATNQNIKITGTTTTGANQRGIFVQNTSDSTNTGELSGVLVNFATSAASYTVTSAHNFRAQSLALGAGSAVTNLYGFYADAMTSGTNNYGAYINEPSGGTINRAIFLPGTTSNGGLWGGNGAFALWGDGNNAVLDSSVSGGTGDLFLRAKSGRNVTVDQNAFAVTVGVAAIGTTTSSTATLNLSSTSLTSGVSQRGIFMGNWTPTSSATVEMSGASIGITTPNSSFTTTDVRGFYYGGAAKGAAHTITNQAGFQCGDVSTSVGNQYAFRAGTPSGGSGQNIGYGAGSSHGTVAGNADPIGLLSTYSRTISGTVSDGFTSAVEIAPDYNAGSAQTLTRGNYIVLQNTMAGTNVTVTDAATFYFNANAGTHKAVDGGTTKTTPSTVNAWMKINVNGTIYYLPAYTSKTS